jgi:hypothetical protein
MRSLKSTTSTTTTLKGKRKLAQAKEYPDSPPATPPNGKSSTTRGKKRVSEANSPPSKRRRSSDRIANKTRQKRTSMEDDDGFVFTRAPKHTRKVAEVKEVSRPAKPFVMDFTAEVSLFNTLLMRLLLRQAIHFNPLVNRNGLHRKLIHAPLLKTL